jgi:hypothetical protein
LEIDLEQLRRQYAMLTDEALLEIDPHELVDSARQCYDHELLQRGLRAEKRGDATEPFDESVLQDQGEPAWLEDAITAMSVVEGRGGPSVLDARSVLDQAGLPCYVMVREPEEPGGPRSFDLLVPPGQHLLALSALDRDFFNPQMEADWKAHFEVLTDRELLDLDADLLVAGMRDRIDRLVRAYEDELIKRDLAEIETGPAN